MPSPQSQKEVGRRAVVALVKDCIAQVNGLTVGFTEVRTANNALAEQTGLDVQRLDGRLDGVGQWCKRNEHAIECARKHREYIVRQIGSNHVEFLAFTELMTFWQRLRWLFTGTWDRPVRAGEGLVATVDEGKKTITIASTDRAQAMPSSMTAASGYIPHVSLGPRVLP